jgi:hypothetical protein
MFTKGVPYFQMTYKSQEKFDPVIGTFLFIETELVNGVEMFLFEYCAFYRDSEDAILMEFTLNQCESFLTQDELAKELSQRG